MNCKFIIVNDNTIKYYFIGCSLYKATIVVVLMLIVDIIKTNDGLLFCTVIKVI